MKKLKERLKSEGVAIEELTDQVGMLESQNYQLRQQNQQFSDKLNQSASQCETCIDYIKEVRRLEIGMQKAENRERQAQDTIKRLQTDLQMKDVRIADLEDEVREVQDTVNRSLSYSAREYDLIRQLEKMKV